MFPGNLCRGNNHVGSFCVFGDQSSAAVHCLVRQFDSITSGVLSFDSTKINFQKLSPERANLFTSGSAHVVTFDNGAKTASCGDRLQPGNACAENKDACWWDSTRSRHQ